MVFADFTLKQPCGWRISDSLLSLEIDSNDWTRLWKLLTQKKMLAFKAEWEKVWIIYSNDFYWVLNTCAGKLAGEFKVILSLLPLPSEVPTCFKRASIKSLPNKSMVPCLVDYCPVGITSTIMKRLVTAQINSCLRHHKSTADAISQSLYDALDHLENWNTIVGLLFSDQFGVQHQHHSLQIHH